VKKGKFIQLGLLIIGILAIIDTLSISNRSGGIDVGILLPAIGGTFIILGLIFTKTVLYKKNTKFFNKIAKLMLGLFIVWLISFVVVVTVILTSATTDRNEKVDSLIVLGSGLKGETPTLVLLERLNYSVEYLNENPNMKAIVSGGQGFGESITEAEGMKRYLVSRGISEDRIIKEEKSTSTYENMIFSKKVYEKTTGKKLEKVMLITNDFHMFRSKLLARRVGLEPYSISASTPLYIYPNVLLREYLAVFKSLIFDR
jgi:uncharacterized SAM-binding protein YcdF (DUF218 family)